jgi:hypothetical protein
MTRPTLLWTLYGQSGALTECTLHELATGHFEIRITRNGAVLFGERYPTADEARAHASDYYESLIAKGWHRAA